MVMDKQDFEKVLAETLKSRIFPMKQDAGFYSLINRALKHTFPIKMGLSPSEFVALRNKVVNQEPINMWEAAGCFNAISAISASTMGYDMDTYCDSLLLIEPYEKEWNEIKDKIDQEVMAQLVSQNAGKPNGKMQPIRD